MGVATWKRRGRLRQVLGCRRQTRYVVCVGVESVGWLVLIDWVLAIGLGLRRPVGPTDLGVANRGSFGGIICSAESLSWLTIYCFGSVVDGVLMAHAVYL